MRIVLNFVTLLATGYGSYHYVQAWAAYDPEAVCKKQDMPQEQCLDVISTAMAGGF